MSLTEGHYPFRLAIILNHSTIGPRPFMRVRSQYHPGHRLAKPSLLSHQQ